MEITLSEAIAELRAELRKSILEGPDQDIIFTPSNVEIELALTFKTEAEAKGGVKVLTLLSLSAGGSASHENLHKVKLSLSVADRNGNPVKVSSEIIPSTLP